MKKLALVSIIITLFSSSNSNSTSYEENLGSRYILDAINKLRQEVSGMHQLISEKLEATNVIRTCQDTKLHGIVNLTPNIPDFPQFPVFCDQSTHCGGWIVIQKRFDGETDFNRNWEDYKHGFGDVGGEYWLGLAKIHRLTKMCTFELLIILKTYGGDERWIKYDSFSVGSETHQYKLHVERKVYGNVADSFIILDDIKFSTPDRDNDLADSKHCAKKYKCGWWFLDCYQSNLNGLYGKDRGKGGIVWHELDDDQPLKEAQMMIRIRKHCSTC